MKCVIASEKGDLGSRLRLLHAHPNMICVERICHLCVCFFFFFGCATQLTSLVAQRVKRLPATQETWV